MTRVALIVTGRLEELALADSLNRVFPDTTFYVEKKLDCFTSSRVRDLGATRTPSLADKLAQSLVATVDPGRDGHPADLVLVVEDLEVANLDQPDVVVDVLRNAVARHIDAHWPSQARRERAHRRLRERASFHLLCPMTEAYFFGDRATLAAAGVTAQPRLEPDVDLESFSVVDTTYLSEPRGTKTWATENRRRHPKHYLQFLLEPDAYAETEHGRRALDQLDWSALVAAHASHLSFARSMLADLADALGLPAARFMGPRHPATARAPSILRNA